jgi:hypothetical protein
MTQDCFILPYTDEHEDAVRTLLDEHSLELPSDQLPPIGGVALVNHNKIITIAGYIGGYLTYGDNSFVEILAVNSGDKYRGIGLRLASYIGRTLKNHGAKNVQWFIEGDSDHLIWHKLILGEEAAASLTPMYVSGVSLDYICHKLEELIHDRQEKV